MKNLIPTIIIALAIISCSCDSTEPPIEIDPPGRRDYTWSVDTLKDNFLHLWRTWGSSSKDVWVVGGGSTSDGVPLYHYDGEKWEKPSGSFLDIQTIYGFNSSDVWAGGLDGWIYHYDGTEWTRNFQYVFDKNAYVEISDIWGIASDNIYAVGVAILDSDNFKRGFVLHYNGVEWTENYKGEKNTYFKKIRANQKSNKTYYIFGLIEDVNTLGLYSYQDGNMNEIYRSTAGYRNMLMVKNEICIILESKVYTLENNQLIEKFKIDIPNFGGTINGRSFNDLFIAMLDGVVHYNGTDYVYLLRFEQDKRFLSSEGYIFDDTVFFTSIDRVNLCNYIYKGK